MIFLFISIFVPIAIWLFLPWIMQNMTGRHFERDGLLLVACLCFFISWYLPSPLIHEMNTQFTTHLVGGGVFSGLLWWYLQRQLQWNSAWLFELITVFAVVSSLGVINELFELGTVELHVTRLNGADTWWDLLANTLGAFLVWFLYRIFTSRKKGK